MGARATHYKSMYMRECSMHMRSTAGPAPPPALRTCMLVMISAHLLIMASPLRCVSAATASMRMGKLRAGKAATRVSINWSYDANQ